MHILSPCCIVSSNTYFACFRNLGPQHKFRHSFNRFHGLLWFSNLRAMDLEDVERVQEHAPAEGYKNYRAMGTSIGFYPLRRASHAIVTRRYSHEWSCNKDNEHSRSCGSSSVPLIVFLYCPISGPCFESLHCVSAERTTKTM